MSEKEYAKSIIDMISEDHIDEVIGYLMNMTDEDHDEEKFELVSQHILSKYHKAFEELAK